MSRLRTCESSWRDDALELLAVELLEQPGRDRDRRMLRVAAGGERVGRRVLDQVDARHRHVGRDGHLAHDVHQLRGGGLIDLSRAADRQHERVAREVRPDPGQASEDHRAHGQGDSTGRFAGHGEADREPEEPQQDDDERRHEERVPPIGGDLVVEGAGHGASRGRRDQVRLRSTFGTLAASGSASKNSRFAKPSGPARRTFGNVAIAVL